MLGVCKEGREVNKGEIEFQSPEQRVGLKVTSVNTENRATREPSESETEKLKTQDVS